MQQEINCKITEDRKQRTGTNKYEIRKSKFSTGHLAVETMSNNKLE